MLLLLLLKSVLCRFERGAAALEKADRGCAPANAEVLWAGDVLIEVSLAIAPDPALDSSLQAREACEMTQYLEGRLAHFEA